MKIKCYFAHPYTTKDSEDEARIIEILNSRGVEVINPFDGEEDYIKEHFGVKSYYPTTPYKVGRWIWTKCITQIGQSNMTLFWIPEDTRLPPIGHFMTMARGCYAEIQYTVDYQNRIMRRNIHKNPEEQNPYIIQFITEDRHPIIAWALCYNNQLYDNIDDFERYRQIRW